MKAVLKRSDGKCNSSSLETNVSEIERRCLASGMMKPRREMIRFVIAPDKSVVPDLSENLPGHGLWVTAGAEPIRLAAKKNLFAKAAKENARVEIDLDQTVMRLLRKRCCEFFGLAKGAGIAILGEAQTEAASRAGKVALLLRAPDAARILDNRHNVPDCTLFSRDEMGSAFGYDQIVYAGFTPHGLSQKLIFEIKRLQLLLPIEKNEG